MHGNSDTMKLKISMLCGAFSVGLVFAQAQPSYGTNSAAGHYVQTADAKLYCERYGNGGTPLVLPHGGECGYIDEFGDLIREMSTRRTAIATSTIRWAAWLTCFMFSRRAN